jgi:predicted negative regulator of RcsB-dependent stress response
MMPGLRRRPSAVRRIIRYSLAVAATLLLVIGAWLGWNFYQLSPERVYRSAYQSYELSNTRDGGSTPTPLETAFRAKEFTQVVQLAEANQALSTKEQLLAGLAHLELHQWPEAVTRLTRTMQEAARQPEPLLQQEAEYYRALALLRNGDFDFALEQLQQIYDNPAHAYNDRVTRRLLRNVRLLKWR